MTTYTISLSTDKQTDVTVDEFGSGHAVLLLHGGAGPQSMMGFGQRFAASEQAHVYVPTHPGFGGTTRPDWLNSMGTLAETYVALIEQLDLHDVTVIGGGIGGWVPSWRGFRRGTRLSHF